MEHIKLAALEKLNALGISCARIHSADLNADLITAAGTTIKVTYSGTDSGWIWSLRDYGKDSADIMILVRHEEGDTDYYFILNNFHDLFYKTNEERKQTIGYSTKTAALKALGEHLERVQIIQIMDDEKRRMNSRQDIANKRRKDA